MSAANALLVGAGWRPQGQRERLALGPSRDAELDLVARVVCAEGVAQLPGALDGAFADGGDRVARLEARLGRRGAGADLGDPHPILAQGVGHDPEEPGAQDPRLAQPRDRSHGVDRRDREPDPGVVDLDARLSALHGERHQDPEHLALERDEGAP